MFKKECKKKPRDAITSFHSIKTNWNLKSDVHCANGIKIRFWDLKRMLVLFLNEIKGKLCLNQISIIVNNMWREYPLFVQFVAVDRSVLMF